MIRETIQKVQCMWTYGLAPILPVYKLFCKVVSYTYDLKCKENWNLYSKEIEATLAPIC